MLQPFDQRFNGPVVRNLKLDSLESSTGRHREAIQERDLIEHVMQICSQFGHGLISFDRTMELQMRREYLGTPPAPPDVAGCLTTHLVFVRFPGPPFRKFSVQHLFPVWMIADWLWIRRDVVSIPRSRRRADRHCRAA